MSHARTALLAALCVCFVFGRYGEVKAQALAPKAAEQYASDAEEAARGDPEAAYRMGEAFESGRLGGLKDLIKALRFYKLAAQKGHEQAAARVAQIEAELSQPQEKPGMPPSSLER